MFVFRQLLGKDGLVQRMDQVLPQIEAAGFAGVQHFLDCVSTPQQADAYGALLAKCRLLPAGLFASGSLYDAELAKPFEESLLDSLAVAMQHINLRSLTLSIEPLKDKARKSDAQLECQAASLVRLSEQLAREGIRLLAHFNATELAENGREFKRMMRLVPGRMMGVCFDVDCVYRAGILPCDLLDPFAPRMQETHLRSTRGGVWDEALGDGDVRLEDLVELLEDYDFKGWHVVELMREARTSKSLKIPESLRLSYTYAKSVLLTARGIAKAPERAFD